MGWVWNRHAPTFFLSHEQCTRPIEKITDMCLHFFYGSCVLFMEPTNMDFSKFFFKIGSYGTIYIFKNYFITIFLIFNNKQYPNRSQWDYFFYDLTSWNCRVILRHKCRQFNALVVSEYFRNFSFTSFHHLFFFFEIFQASFLIFLHDLSAESTVVYFGICLKIWNQQSHSLKKKNFIYFESLYARAHWKDRNKH